MFWEPELTGARHRRALSQALSNATQPRAGCAHRAGHGGGAGRSACRWRLELHGQPRRQPAHPPRAVLHRSAREGPDLDGPGQDRQERERVHVDSESLDDEDS